MHFKLAKIVWSFILLGVSQFFTPRITTIMIIVSLIVLDFITGIIKAIINQNARTSEGYRKTLMKVPGYIIVPVVLWLAGQYSSAHAYSTKDPSTMIQLAVILKSLSGWVLLFIMYIEIKSIFENLYEIDKTSPFNKYFVRPLLIILSFGIENNPLKNAADRLRMEQKDQAKKSLIDQNAEADKKKD